MKKISMVMMLLLLNGLLHSQNKLTEREKVVNYAACKKNPVLLSSPLIIDTIPSADIVTFITNTLFGNCVTVSNVAYTGASIAVGSFTDTTVSFGLHHGLILATGSVFNAIGPNDNGLVSADLSQPGDSLLKTIANTSTHDAAVIEFDFVPCADSLIVSRFVFGSDEYMEFVGSVNDVFGLFISGPGLSNQNVAVLPNTSIPISINNVSAFTNSQYYVNNTDEVKQFLNEIEKLA